MDTDKHRHKKALLNPSCTRRLHKSSVSICVYLWLISFFAFTATTQAQVRPVYDRGAVGLMQMLKRLNTTASVMMIGAHPDDEDSALLAYLARGENARTAYLSLTRGDGGQNIIGPELFESLGVIRTEELLQARRLDGGEQYFTSAFDYGYSKTLDEAKQKWDEKVILCDTVRAIRLFRPLVVISRFSGTPADGHGQHQFAGYISPIAVKAAADPNQCAQSGQTWRVRKFYTGQGFAANSTATLRLNTGAYDPMLGRSYFEIAMEGRSQHKSQGEGRLEFYGEQFSGLNLVESVPPKVENEKSIFDGVRTRIADIDDLFGISEARLSEKLAELQKSIDELAAVNLQTGSILLIPELAKGYKAVYDAYWSTRQPEVKFVLEHKKQQFADAIRIAAGIQVDALADRETIVPGEVFFSAVKVFLPGGQPIRLKEINLLAPAGWPVIKAQEPKETTPAFNRRETANLAEYFSVTVPADARPTQPVWIENPRDGDLYRWPMDENQNLPFQPPRVMAEVKVEINGTEITLNQPVQFRYADPARGEIRRELNVVPALSVSVDQKLLIVPQSKRTQTRTLTMSITNNSAKAVSGIVSLNINAANDWPFTANSRTFSLKSKGEKATVRFDVTIPAKTKPGTYNISANAMVGESLATQTMNTIAYPHIQTHRFYTRAETSVNVLELKVAPVKVGYIMGSGDEVPDAIRQMGRDVTMLEEKDLASGDLSKYDSIFVGIRASETRPDFVSNNQRLLDYVKSGGNLIVQYQRGGFTQLLPFPATTSPRVVDENAKVTILQPHHPFFCVPNKITDEDFKGWVHERNLYNFNTFDANYTPLLESHDAGEAENKGGLVTARIGKGNWTYCSYSFFRQLPAGVGGAYRLFANLLSQSRAPKK